MEICDYQHDQIVHTEKTCPLCLADDKISDLEDELKDLKEKVEDLEIEKRDLNTLLLEVGINK